MKRPLYALALSACVLMTLAGCGAASQTPSAPNESEVTITRPDTSPESSEKVTGQPDAPQESQRPSPDEAEEPDEGQLSGGAPQAEAPASPSPVPSDETDTPTSSPSSPPPVQSDAGEADTGEPEAAAPVISQIARLEQGFSSASFSGDDGFQAFLEQGGAASDAQVAEFLSAHFLADAALAGNPFGCSTLAVQSPNGDRLFGRNFDWQACEALALTSTPAEGYASISTVNLDFIRAGDSGSLSEALSQNDVRVLAALYAPLDGMNEKGLAVSVNMIQDAAIINQDTGKPDLTTTTAIRLLLNKAASVDEALELLGQYDLHASLGMMVHFALADTTGRSVVVEYIGNRMEVTETPVVTNFYLAEGAKHGVGTAQSHTRYDILIQALEQQQTMNVDGVRDALDSVSKDNFGEFESTEWSAVFNLSTGEARYYHRENYGKAYEFSIK